MTEEPIWISKPRGIKILRQTWQELLLECDYKRFRSVDMNDETFEHVARAGYQMRGVVLLSKNFRVRFVK